MLKIDLQAKKLYFSGAKEGGWWNHGQDIKLPQFEADIYSAYQNPKTRAVCMLLAYLPEIPALPEGIKLKDYNSDYKYEYRNGALTIFANHKWGEPEIYYSAEKLIQSILVELAGDLPETEIPTLNGIDPLCFGAIPGITTIPDIFGHCPDIYTLDLENVRKQFLGKEPEFDYKNPSWSKKWDAWHKAKLERQKEAPALLISLLRFKKTTSELVILEDIYKSGHRYLGTERKPVLESLSTPEPTLVPVSTDNRPPITDHRSLVYSEQLTLTF